MANKRNKKSSKKSRGHLIVRNWAAVAAQFKTSAGSHEDRRTRRCRNRSAQKRAALAEYR